MVGSIIISRLLEFSTNRVLRGSSDKSTEKTIWRFGPLGLEATRTMRFPLGSGCGGFRAAFHGMPPRSAATPLNMFKYLLFEQGGALIL